MIIELRNHVFEGRVHWVRVTTAERTVGVLQRAPDAFVNGELVEGHWYPVFNAALRTAVMLEALLLFADQDADATGVRGRFRLWPDGVHRLVADAPESELWEALKASFKAARADQVDDG